MHHGARPAGPRFTVLTRFLAGGRALVWEPRSLDAYRAFHLYWLAPCKGSFQNAPSGIGTVDRARPPT